MIATKIMMRPTLDKNISVKSFQDYYWLKVELVDFCRKNQLPVSGGKQELQEKIAHFLTTGEKLKPKPKNSNKKNITIESLLEESYKNDEPTRVFFKSVIGERFKFNVVFMKWAKQNPKKTYQDAIDEWLKIEKEKKAGKKHKIDSQFEYNQYTRDFFNANPNKNRTDAIKCWKYKKSMPGSNKYESTDLNCLK